jgi:hypothetical protein
MVYGIVWYILPNYNKARRQISMNDMLVNNETARMIHEIRYRLGNEGIC